MLLYITFSKWHQEDRPRKFWSPLHCRLLHCAMFMAVGGQSKLHKHLRWVLQLVKYKWLINECIVHVFFLINFGFVFRFRIQKILHFLSVETKNFPTNNTRMHSIKSSITRMQQHFPHVFELAGSQHCLCSFLCSLSFYVRRILSNRLRLSHAHTALCYSLLLLNEFYLTRK